MLKVNEKEKNHNCDQRNNVIPALTSGCWGDAETNPLLSVLVELGWCWRGVVHSGTSCLVRDHRHGGPVRVQSDVREQLISTAVYVIERDRVVSRQ